MRPIAAPLGSFSPPPVLSQRNKLADEAAQRAQSSGKPRKKRTAKKYFRPDSSEFGFDPASEFQAQMQHLESGEAEETADLQAEEDPASAAPGPASPSPGADVAAQELPPLRRMLSASVLQALGLGTTGTDRERRAGGSASGSGSAAGSARSNYGSPLVHAVRSHVRNFPSRAAY